MRISSLRYFYEVAELKSISKVSTNLHISQPALSHQLFKLEKELGEKLLERSNRGVELTSKGEVLYNYAKEMITLHNNLIEEMKVDNCMHKEIKINISSIYANFIMDNVAKNLPQIFKNDDVSINNQLDANEKALLLNDRADVVIGCKKIEDTDLISNHIGNDKLILVSKEYISQDKLKKVSIAVFNDRLNVTSNIIQKLNNINICLKTDSLDMIKGYLKNSDVVAIVPKISVEEELKKGILVDLGVKEYEEEYNLFITYKKDINGTLKKKIKVFSSELECILNKDRIHIAI